MKYFLIIIFIFPYCYVYSQEYGHFSPVDKSITILQIQNENNNSCWINTKNSSFSGNNKIVLVQNDSFPKNYSYRQRKINAFMNFGVPNLLEAGFRFHFFDHWYFELFERLDAIFSIYRASNYFKFSSSDNIRIIWHSGYDRRFFTDIEFSKERSLYNDPNRYFLFIQTFGWESKKLSRIVSFSSRIGYYILTDFIPFFKKPNQDDIKGGPYIEAKMILFILNHYKK
jgi:hypothetical protein